MRNKKGKGPSINNVPILSPQDLRNVGIENAFKAENLVTDEELEELPESEFSDWKNLRDRESIDLPPENSSTLM